MNTLKKKIREKLDYSMARFAYAFAGGTINRICFYIFHQPTVPEEVMKLKEK